jgi:hypothetical protein
MTARSFDDLNLGLPIIRLCNYCEGPTVRAQCLDSAFWRELPRALARRLQAGGYTTGATCMPCARRLRAELGLPPPRLRILEAAQHLPDLYSALAEQPAPAHRLSAPDAGDEPRSADEPRSR